MDIKAIPRRAVESSLSIARLPVEQAARLVSRGDAVTVVLDRADAALRGLAGVALRDSVLQDEAARLSTAANERQRAGRLRIAAEEEAARQEAKANETRSKASKTREQAAKQANARRERIEDEKEARERELSERESKKKQAVKTAEAEIEESIDSEAKRARLAQLDEEAESLEEHREALKSKNEAQRLAKAAARAKQERKTS
jgi:hypothetical protein